MDYNYAYDNPDMKRIDKLNALTNPDTFWSDVRKLTRRVKSDYAIGRWECLAEKRWEEIKHGADVLDTWEE